MRFLCPICAAELNQADRCCVCPNRHSFDIARQGYLNLLTVQQKHSLSPGDTREQVLSRRAFLDAGFYAPILDTLIRTAQKYGVSGEILDVGCGEGYYSAGLAAALNLPLTGLDISKEADRKSVKTLTSLFALTLPEEFHRVLGPEGLFFQVLAAEDHLMGLKSIIYDQIHFKQKDTIPTLPGFDRLESIPIRFSFTVEGAQVQNLFSMTPHVFRIGRAGARRLQEAAVLSDTASCVLNVYRRQ